MAFQDFDDYEKSEVVAHWLRENAVAIVSGIVLGLLLIFGINQWRQHQAGHNAEAASQYAALRQAVQSDNQAGIDAARASLRDKYKNTPFAVFAAFQQAEQAVASGNAADAEKPLQWAREHAGDQALKSLAQLRLARVQLAAGKVDAALQSLDQLPADAYPGLAAELRGDALETQQKTQQARDAYELALQTYEDREAPTGMVQLKLDNLAPAEKQKS